jgi:hypothetical protein
LQQPRSFQFAKAFYELGTIGYSQSVMPGGHRFESLIVRGCDRDLEARNV